MRAGLGTAPKPAAFDNIRAHAAYPTEQRVGSEDARTGLAAKAMAIISRATSAVKRRRFGHVPKTGDAILAALGSPGEETLGKSLDAGQWEITLAAADVHAGVKWRPKRWAIATALARVGVKLGEWWSHVARICRDAKVLNPGAAIAQWVIPEVLAKYRDVIATIVPPKPVPAQVPDEERLARFQAARAAWRSR